MLDIVCFDLLDLTIDRMLQAQAINSISILSHYNDLAFEKISESNERANFAYNPTVSKQWRPLQD